MAKNCSIAARPGWSSDKNGVVIGVAEQKEGLVAEVVHTSRLRLERVAGPIRHAYLEGFTEPIRFGVHGGIKAFYGVEPEEEVPATLDYIVGAVGG
jgi:hypothetical protein